MTPRRRTAGAEPPVVVDASIAVQWFAHEAGSTRAARLIEGDRRLIAPDLMPVEAANAWWKKRRRKEMDAADVTQAVGHLFALGIEWIAAAPLVARALEVAVEHDHPIYDCLYVVAARDRQCELATADERLRALAGALDVTLWSPD